MLLLLLGFDLNHFDAVVCATARAYLVRRLEIFALRAHHKLARLERQMAAPAIPPTLLDFAFWKSTHGTTLLST
jgi:hypothetical protein